MCTSPFQHLVAGPDDSERPPGSLAPGQRSIRVEQRSASGSEPTSILPVRPDLHRRPCLTVRPFRTRRQGRVLRRPRSAATMSQRNNRRLTGANISLP